MAASDFNDFIVIQGPAGSGKSSFTLHLCNELIHQGLQPIRVELKHLDTSPNRNIRETLPDAVRLGNATFDPDRKKLSFGKDLFFDNKIFEEQAEFRGLQISRYVLILDAWDEISVGASEGYQQHIERLLSEIRGMFLANTGLAHPIRVVITGRPTEAVTQGKLMMQSTCLLTLRLFTPEQLTTFHDRLSSAITATPVLPSNDWTAWNPPDQEMLSQIRHNYEKDHIEAKNRREAREQREAGHILTSISNESLELLGSPLLGLLSFRLFAQWPSHPEILLRSRTVLYRSLMDLLLSGGKINRDDTEQQTVHFQGPELRELLWHTAEAITVLDLEAIPKTELQKRLQKTGLSLNESVKSLVEEHKLSRLLVSFFFHGGTDEQGCEFSHKSFREYLFAEGIVELLKEYGRSEKRMPPKLSDKNYWQDFESDDPRRRLSRRLARMLGPQWITKEVGEHIAELIEWEVARACGSDSYPAVQNGTPTEKLTKKQWKVIRDALADIWCWWGEGVHLRTQPYETDDTTLGWHEPLAVSVAKSSRMLTGSIESIRPTRTCVIDSHLGDGLFQLCCDVHRSVWSNKIAEKNVERRPYQSIDLDTKLVRFRPGSGDFLHTYVHRIEASGFRERFRSEFPRGINLATISLALEYLPNITLHRSQMMLADITGACLISADLIGADLTKTSLIGADLTAIHLEKADLSWANLSEANINGGNLNSACLVHANLKNAELRSARFRNANLRSADFSNADLRDADLTDANLRSANFTNAKLAGATISSNQFRNARTETELKGVNWIE